LPETRGLSKGRVLRERERGKTDALSSFPASPMAAPVARPLSLRFPPEASLREEIAQARHLKPFRRRPNPNLPDIAPPVLHVASASQSASLAASSLSSLSSASPLGKAGDRLSVHQDGRRDGASSQHTTFRDVKTNGGGVSSCGGGSGGGYAAAAGKSRKAGRRKGGGLAVGEGSLLSRASFRDRRRSAAGSSAGGAVTSGGHGDNDASRAESGGSSSSCSSSDDCTCASAVASTATAEAAAAVAADGNHGDDNGFNVALDDEPSVLSFETDFVTSQTLVQLTDSISHEINSIESEKLGNVSQHLGDESVNVPVNVPVNVSGNVSDEVETSDEVLDVLHDPWRVEGLDLQGPSSAVVRRTRVCPIQRTRAAARAGAEDAAGDAERIGSADEPVVGGRRSRRRGKGRRTTGDGRANGGVRGGGERERQWAGAVSKARDGRAVAGAVTSGGGGESGLAHAVNAAGIASSASSTAGTAGTSLAAAAAASPDASSSVDCAAARIAPGTGFAARGASRGARGGVAASRGAGRGGARGEAEEGADYPVKPSSPQLSEGEVNVQPGSQAGALIGDGHYAQGGMQGSQEKQEEEEGEEEGEEGEEGVGASSGGADPRVGQAAAAQRTTGTHTQTRQVDSLAKAALDDGAVVPLTDAAAAPEAAAAAPAAAATGLAMAGGGMAGVSKPGEATAGGGMPGGGVAGGGIAWGGVPGEGMAEEGVAGDGMAGGGAAGVGSVCAGRVVKGKGPGQYLFRAEDGEGFTSVDVGANGMSVVCNARGCRPVRVDESFVDRHGLPQSLSQLPNGAGRLADGGALAEMVGEGAVLGMGGGGVELLGGVAGGGVGGEGELLGGAAGPRAGMGGGEDGAWDSGPVGRGGNGSAMVEEGREGREGMVEVERKEDGNEAGSWWRDERGSTAMGGRDAREARDAREGREGRAGTGGRDEREGRAGRAGREEIRGAESAAAGYGAGTGKEGRRGGESGRVGKEGRGEEGAVMRGGAMMEGPAVGRAAAASVEGEDEQYMRAVHSDPTNALLLCDYARFLCEIRDYPRADEMFRRAVAASQAEGRARVKGRATGVERSRNSTGSSAGVKGVQGGVIGVQGITGVEEGEVLVLWAKAVWEGWRDGERALALFDHAVEVAPDDCYVLAAYASFLWSVESASPASSTGTSSSSSSTSSRTSSSSSSTSSTSSASASAAPAVALCLSPGQGQKHPSMRRAVRAHGTASNGSNTSDASASSVSTPATGPAGIFSNNRGRSGGNSGGGSESSGGGSGGSGDK
ncbi:hypothetical protein CLOP_g19171, partial [Closterium sp. NIES-67]